MFPFRSFLYYFTLLNSNHVISAWQVGKKTEYWSPKHWIYFKTTESILCLYFFVAPGQIQCPFLYTLLLNCFPFPSICLFPYFRLFASRLPITRTFFNFPWRFKLSGVDYKDNFWTLSSQGLFESIVINLTKTALAAVIWGFSTLAVTMHELKLLKRYDEHSRHFYGGGPPPRWCSPAWRPKKINK